MTKMNSVVVVDAIRTPIGSLCGKLSSMSAPELGSVVIGALYKNNSLNPDIIDEVIMGQAIQAGSGQAPARQSALKAGLKNTIPCTTINQGCASGMKAIGYAIRQIGCGDAEVMVAGGMESMSNVPHYQMDSRFGTRMGDLRLSDGILLDGLRDPVKKQHMGHAAELCAQTYGLSRQEQDDHAIESCRRSQQAGNQGAFDAETASVKIRDRSGHAEVIERDEIPGRTHHDRFSEHAPAYQKNGTVTAGNSFKTGDGAAALLLMSEKKAGELGLSPLAHLMSQFSTAQAPKWFTTSAAHAIPQALKRAGLATTDIDLFEIHETFSASTLANMKLLQLTADSVNIHGGAVGLGHPLGCSGARILVTLLHALRWHEKKRGCAAIAGGGGEASAMVMERM